ncbi:YjdF family protein [Breznakia pachnodae]|uniref:DUF2992 family protein n=1 Tax=Breznakia pachnodae TaxID=265178 RepID=A0ABU0E329_9FIRM|nr:YjdF family protein [Breznakia pachnodae]MDQ0361131.1 hypothetical protein [Breznakia pachnodae]
MEKIQSKLTVYFENPFWVGVYEIIDNGNLEVCKITFGSEPKDYEVYEYLNHNWYSLQFSKPVQAEMKFEKKINPKRMQRQVKKQTQTIGVGTKSQQAIKNQQEEGKLARKKQSSLERKQRREKQFLLKQIKRKSKHRGH